MQIHTQNDEIKTKRSTLLPVSDADVEESCFNAKLKFLINNFYFFSVLRTNFLKLRSNLTDILYVIAELQTLTDL